MTKLSVFIPFRDVGDRVKQLNWLKAKWDVVSDDIQLIVAEDDGQQPFSKTIAVNNCYRQATSDVFAILDADVWLDPKVLIQSAKTIANDPNKWIMPCDLVWRVTKTKTKEIVDNPDFDLFTLSESDCSRITPVVGAASVFSRKQFETLGGMDPRFRGWGGEDNAWNLLMTDFFGKPESWSNPLFHLWHPTPRDEDNKKIWAGQTDRNTVTLNEYIQASKVEGGLKQIAKENQARTKIINLG
jgi:predicted glycosyltransferase involved in capsule biosynthesis